MENLSFYMEKVQEGYGKSILAYDKLPWKFSHEPGSDFQPACTHHDFLLLCRGGGTYRLNSL